MSRDRKFAAYGGRYADPSKREASLPERVKAAHQSPKPLEVAGEIAELIRHDQVPLGDKLALLRRLEPYASESDALDVADGRRDPRPVVSLQTWTVRLEEYGDGTLEASVFEDGRQIGGSKMTKDARDGLKPDRARSMAVMLAAMDAEGKGSK